MSHMTLNDRKMIANMLSKRCSATEIGNVLEFDPTTIAKEIKRNRIISKEAKYGAKNKILCKKLDHYPFVCLDCPRKYRDCVLTQFCYNAGIAQETYERKLHNTRKGINLTSEEYTLLNEILKEGLKNKKSVYSIIKDSDLDISTATVYRYIANRKIEIRKMDLPYAVTYKKRKKQTKEYDYPNNKIDRSNRTYIDYLAYKKSHINEMTVQMDFLGSIKSDSKSILTLIIPEIHFVLLFIIENKNSDKVVSIFDDLERRLGEKDFHDIFPSILTDRDPCFSNFMDIEFNKETGVNRTHLFFCDAFKSIQKANVENMNKQLRRFFPKGTSIDSYKKEDITRIAKIVNETKILSLDGRSPKDAFKLIFGNKIYDVLFE